MKKNYLLRVLKSVFVLIFILLCTQTYSQNWGFESTTISSPPNNWSAVTGSWTINTANVRSGVNSMAITDPATTGTTIGTTNPFVTTTSAGNYLITIGWGKSNTASNALFYLGYRTGTTNTLNPTSTSTGQAANINDVTWSRVTSVSAATVAAGSYGISLRAFRSASTAGTTLYIDDIIMYASPSNVPDYSAPDPATNVLLSSNVLTWSNGLDNGTPASGIGGVIILRANGVNLTAPTLNPQAMYDAGTTGAAGSNTIINGPDTWSVIANIAGSSTTSFTDPNASGGPYTYAIYMRDLAYNYSTPVTAVIASPCVNPPTPGTSTSSAINAVCPGSNVNLGLSGNSFGLNQTYQWQSSSTLNGTYTNIGTASANSSLQVNPMVSTYYRCEVICSAGSPVYSTPVQVNVQSGYSGTFTINASSPTGGTNYQTFADAISALTNCGITGPVIYNVDSASGPFTSQIILPVINGASSTNTITFNGNGAVINFLSTTTGERAGIKLNGADYIRINNFNIIATGTTTTEYGFGIQLLNDANHNIIENNKINLNLTSTSTTNYCGIIVNSIATAITTAGASLCDSNIIRNNRIVGGYAGIALVGNGSTSVINGNQVLNNNIKDFYTYGIYLNGGERTIIEGNDISRPTRTATAVFNGVYLTGVSTNTQISKNIIHDPYTVNKTATTASFAIYLTSASATAGNENIISNNLVYNLIGATGNKNALLINASNNVKAYHNTFYLNDDSATCTACANRGIYIQGTAVTGLDFRNNNIFISSGGTASKQCIFFEPTSVANYTLENNNYYITSTTGTINEVARTGGSSSVATQGTGYITIADWKVGSAKEISSTSVDPLFVNTSIGNLEPTNGSLNNTGVAVGILTDVRNRTRSLSTPDIGAYEFGALVTGLDMAAENVVAPANVSSGCYSATEPVIVRIRNTSLQKINFATNPVTITVDVSGPISASLTKTISTDTLSSNGFFDVTMLGTLNMSSSGTYTISARTFVLNDVNINNDTVIANRTKSIVVAGTVSTTPAVFCVNPGTPALSATGFSGYGNLQWQMSTTSGTGFVDIPNATGLTFTLTSPITQTTYFRLAATCGSTTVYSIEDTAELVNPQVISATGAASCGTDSLQLSAVGSPGTTLNWYANSTGGAVLKSGNTFWTPILNSTTNYYVSAAVGGQSGNVGPLNPTVVGSSGGTAAAITTYYMEFQVLSNTVINTIDIFPTATVGSTGTIVVQTTTGTTVGSAQYTTTVSGGAKQTIVLNIPLTPGTYRMGQLAPAIALTRNTAGAVYPYSSSVINILSNNFAANYYYYFYNWNFGSSCESPRTQVTATIQTSPNASISYASPFCSQSGTATVTRTGTAGGKYKSTSGLVIDSLTGQIDLAASSLGTYVVNYTIAANGNCPTFNTSANVTIQNPPNASISYAGSPYCTSGGTASVTRTGNAGGIYSSTTGLILNSSTGAINLTNSTPGTYTVEYVIIASGNCPSFTTSTTVTINQAETASITYVGSPFCSNGGIITPNRTGSANGTYSSSVGLDINASTGAINLANCTAGAYTVSYTIAATAQCPAFVANYNIVINALPTASIQYPNSTFCLGAGSVSPVVNSSSTGTFSSSAGLNINSSTGEINLVTSTAGTYVVNYIIPAASSCPAVTIPTTITLQAPSTATIAYDSAEFCLNSGIKTVNRIGTSGGRYSSTSGLIIDSLTGSINTNLSTVGTYVVSYKLAATANCPQFIATANVKINALPNSNFNIQSSNGLQMTFLADGTGGLQYLWNFDDPNSGSNTSQLPNPTHVFSAPGSYNVSLTTKSVITNCSNTTIIQISAPVSYVSENANQHNFNAYPNPFSEKTTVEFELNSGSNVSLDVYDLLGKKISTLIDNKSLSSGKHKIDFAKENVSVNGVYLIKLNVNGNISVLRLVQL